MKIPRKQHLNAVLAVLAMLTVLGGSDWLALGHCRGSHCCCCWCSVFYFFIWFFLRASAQKEAIEQIVRVLNRNFHIKHIHRNRSFFFSFYFISGHQFVRHSAHANMRLLPACEKKPPCQYIVYLFRGAAAFACINFTPKEKKKIKKKALTLQVCPVVSWMKRSRYLQNQYTTMRCYLVATNRACLGL